MMDLRRERAIADREVRRRENTFYNLVVDWYEYDRVTTLSDDLYEEGPEREYLPPKPVKLLWIVVLDEGGVPTEEGRVVRRDVRAAVSVRTLETAGVSNPEDATDHLDDVFSFGGELYKINTYEPTGHFGRASGFTIGVTAHRRRPEYDLPNDSWPVVGEL